MPVNLLKYSNGWGHVIMSVCSLATAIILLLQHDPTLNGLAIGVITTVQGYWFVTSSANTMRQSTVQVAVPAPNITLAGAAKTAGEQGVQNAINS